MTSTRRNANALTLIEVVAALVLVATSVTALLAAQGRSLEQLRSARELQTATTLAREIITQWRLDPLVVPPSEGEFPYEPNWRWKRTVGTPTESRRSDLQEIVLAIYRREDRGVERLVAAYTWLETVHEHRR